MSRRTILVYRQKRKNAVPPTEQHTATYVQYAGSREPPALPKTQANPIGGIHIKNSTTDQLYDTVWSTQLQQYRHKTHFVVGEIFSCIMSFFNSALTQLSKKQFINTRNLICCTCDVTDRVLFTPRIYPIHDVTIADCSVIKFRTVVDYPSYGLKIILADLYCYTILW